MSIKVSLRALNNALLDLQSADFNTYERPLKLMAAALNSEDLKSIVDPLKEAVDFDSFIDVPRSGGMGGDSLDWPTDINAQLGLTIVLIERGAEDPKWFMNFSHRFYDCGSSKIIASIRKITTSVLIPFNRDFRAFVEDQALNRDFVRNEPSDFERVFIVHGHDEAPRETVARFITTVGLQPVILHEQANRGMTIPEKLVANGNVGFAIVLLTPDDLGRAKTAKEETPRARQNVILELGYFVGRLGRDRVCALLKDEIEIPSDYMGVVYTNFDQDGGWKQKLAKELDAAGYEIDWNKVMR